jgi:hypothetical protein
MGQESKIDLESEIRLTILGINRKQVFWGNLMVLISKMQCSGK